MFTKKNHFDAVTSMFSLKDFPARLETVQLRFGCEGNAAEVTRRELPGRRIFSIICLFIYVLPDYMDIYIFISIFAVFSLYSLVMGASISET